MHYRAASIDDPVLVPWSSTRRTSVPSGVLENYVYNSRLNGRHYFLQMIQDAGIVARFARERFGLRAFQAAGSGEADPLAEAITEVLSDVRPAASAVGKRILWSEIVDQKRELRPV